MSSIDKQLIFYHLLNNHYTEVLPIADKHSHIPEFKLYRALVYVVAGQYVEAIRHLNDISRSDGDINMATLLLLIYSHKKCMDPDFGVISELEAQLKQTQPCSNEKSLTLASLGLYFTRHHDKALGLAEKALKVNANSVDARLVCAWAEMNKKQTKAANALFKNILTLDPKCLNALLGDVLTTSARSDQLSKLDRILSQYPSVSPPLIEKMNLYLANREWDQCRDLSERLLAIDDKSEVANKMKVFYLINVLGDYNEASNLLASYYHTLLRQESPNACQVLYDWSKLFSRICGRNKAILTATLSYVKHCADSHPSNVIYLEELAYQNYLLGRYEEALRLYRVAIRLDDTSLTLLTGLTMCQFEAGGRVMNEQISQQLDLLTEISSKSISPHLSLIQISLLQSQRDITARLDAIVHHQMSLVYKQPFGYQYLIDFNVDLLLSVLAVYLKLNDSATSCISLLENLTPLVPGLRSVSLLLAQLYIGQTGPDSDKQALVILGHMLESRPEYSVAHLMLCLVYVREGTMDKASHHLEIALSNNLQLIETPLYNALKGLVEDRKGRVPESINSLKTTRQLIQTRRGQKFSPHSGLDLETIELQILHSLHPADLSLVYQKLCSNLVKSNVAPSSGEIDKYIDEASSLLKGTKHWVDLSLMIAEVKEKTDPKYALELLSKVPEHHDKYVQAIERMANIYLNSLKNQDKYIECYRVLLDKDPSTENYVRLAEAYLNIQDADQAVVTYERAKRSNPRAKFGVKLARIFVKTHQYEKAIQCYKEAADMEAMVELGGLYTKLGHLEVALECLEKVDRPTLTAPVLAKIKEKSNDIKSAYQVLKQGVDQSPELCTNAIYRQLATYATQTRDFQAAIMYYKKMLESLSLSASETHAVHIALTKLYMQINDWKSCEALCTQLLSSDSSGSQYSAHNSETTARLILADATFRRGDFVQASEHFASILATSGSDRGEAGATNFTALARYIEIQRRLATLRQNVPTLLTKAGKCATPGYYYCQGLYEWYTGNPLGALAQFNRAKHDPEWGQQSLHNMVEICLANPEIGGSNRGNGGNGSLETAESLIKEMNPSSPEEEMSCKLLTNFIRCASHDRIEFEMALNEFTHLAQNEGTRVGASLGLAKCFVQQNQSSRARNILKLFAKAMWNFEEADYLESCWLLLAELHIQESRPDRASDLIKRTLSYNQSSAKSYELLATIAENREDYDDAVVQYTQACRIIGTSDLALHQKLASLLLKMKRYAEAIDVSQTIMKAHPSYPKVHKQIFEKAMVHLRT
ncbi:hypothetical protein M8J76_013371 [Diaphorina citri]|nr:hypothetical protein M8J76_013371 [Diaphorina citri]